MRRVGGSRESSGSSVEGGWNRNDASSVRPGDQTSTFQYSLMQPDSTSGGHQQSEYTRPGGYPPYENTSRSPVASRQLLTPVRTVLMVE